MVFEHCSSTTSESRRWQKAVQFTLCSETHVVGSQGLVVGIVGFALEVRAEFSAKYNFFTCDPLFVEVRCLMFIRRSFFFPTHGEDVDDASVVYCHFRQVCVGAEEQGHSVGNVSSSHTCDITNADLEFDLCV